MEIRTLRYFLETAREGNMTRAAERLFVSQPTMSKQLKELENELGTRLFIRSNYSIRLTDAGMLLKKRAEDIISLVDKTEAEFRSLEKINSGDIYVGAPESESMALFAEAVSALQKDNPGIRCNIYSGNHEEVCDRLDKGLLDFAIVMSYVDLSKYNYLEIPAKDSWGVLMRKSDPLASKESLTVDELKKYPLICSRQWVDQDLPHWFGEDSDRLNIAATYNLAFNGAVMARAGIGYAVVLDKLIDTSESSSLTFRPLSDVPGTGLYVIWRKYQTFTPVAQLLMNELEKRL
ncbi:MAG: LysR family transcriptional regulator [Eubacterium sp.]|nr:LysR family transcriptional regulator [Eubacterium sp.]